MRGDVIRQYRLSLVELISRMIPASPTWLLHWDRGNREITLQSWDYPTVSNSEGIVKCILLTSPNVAYSAPSHYINQCCVIVNWNLRNKLQWNVNQNTKHFIHENSSENIVCEMEAIVSGRRWINPVSNYYHSSCAKYAGSELTDTPARIYQHQMGMFLWASVISYSLF